MPRPSRCILLHAKDLPGASYSTPKTFQAHPITRQRPSRCILLHAKDLSGASYISLAYLEIFKDLSGAYYISLAYLEIFCGASDCILNKHNIFPLHSSSHIMVAQQRLLISLLLHSNDHIIMHIPGASYYMPKTFQVHPITCQRPSRCIVLHANDLPGASSYLPKIFQVQPLTCKRPSI